MTPATFCGWGADATSESGAYGGVESAVRRRNATAYPSAKRRTPARWGALEVHWLTVEPLLGAELSGVRMETFRSGLGNPANCPKCRFILKSQYEPGSSASGPAEGIAVR